MTLEEIDKELGAWKKNLGAAAQNLMDLHSLPTYQRLTGGNGIDKVPLVGVTAARVYPAIEGMGRLFQNFDELQTAIDKAREIRQSISPIFPLEQKIREIETLLRGKSVRLPVDPTPINQRTLSMAVDDVRWVTPAELMAAMAGSFTAARDVVLSVDVAWQKLGMELDQAMKEAATWKTQFPALSGAEAALSDIRTRIEIDPLGCAEEYSSSVEPVLSRTRAAIAHAQAMRVRLQRGFDSARKQLTGLQELHSQSLASWNDRREKVTCATQPVTPLADSNQIALEAWLERLEDKFQEGLLDPLEVGLQKWNKAALDCVNQERACLEANQQPVKERNELRGRLEALKAKARAKNAAELPELTRLATEASELLFSRPTPLEKASALVVEYERLLRATT